LPFNLQWFRRLRKGCIPFNASFFSPRLDALEGCTSLAIHKDYGEKELGREMLFNISLNAHQKLKLRLVSRGFRVRFGPEVANGVIAELSIRSGFMCVLINAQPSDLGFKCLSRNLELGCGARRTANAPLRFR
jgi:hypothetical protein